MKCSEKPWWSHKYGKDNICGITMARVRPGKNNNGFSYTVTLGCGHSFYRKALTGWLIKCNTPTCPVCREIFEPVICFLK
jgi:hypothetical protein